MWVATAVLVVVVWPGDHKPRRWSRHGNASGTTVAPQCCAGVLIGTLMAADDPSVGMGSGRRIKASETMFSIIEVLREHGRLGVTELSDILGISKGNAHHHLATLRDHGYVVKEDGKYAVGLEFFVVGVDTRSRYPIYQAARDELPDLAAETGETAWCMVEENGEGVFIDGYASGAPLSSDAVIGTRKPLHVSSAGKAILANLPEDRREAIIERDGLEAMTENTVTDRDELRRELETIRDRGFSLNLEEDVGGIHAVGAPVLDADSRVVGAISVGGTATRLTEEYCERELVPLLKATADDIELNLAYK